MVLNDTLKIAIEAKWNQHTHEAVKIEQSFPIYGGDICNCFKIKTNIGYFFLKTGTTAMPSDLLEKEFRGIQLLRQSESVRVPNALFEGKSEQGVFLVMEFIEREPVTTDFWQVFAQKMAALHQNSCKQFGLGWDNYIGILPQKNRPMNSWSEFYASQRLEPLIKACVEKEILSEKFIQTGERLYKKLSDIFPDENPALIHGDLWGGNYLAGKNGEPFIFDPAVCFGNREMDLAMARLFGGFDRKFYWYYQEIFPLSGGWEERIEVCQLYYLLVHAVLFGRGYIQRVRDILNQF